MNNYKTNLNNIITSAELAYFSKEQPFAYSVIICVLIDYAIIMCKIEKKKYCDKNVRADDPKLAEYLEEQYQLNKLTPSGEYYQTLEHPMGLVPSYIVNGREYLREEDDIDNISKEDIVEQIHYYWHLVEKVDMKEVYDEAKKLLNHISNNLLPNAYHGTEESILTILKEEVTKVVLYLETEYPSLDDKSNSKNAIKSY